LKLNINIIILLTANKIIMDNTNELCKEAFTGNYNNVKQLLIQGTDPNKLNHAQKAPLHIAIQYYNFETAQLLIEYGADVNIMGRDHYTPLAFTNYSPWTPLHYAIHRGAPSAVKLLFKYGADLSIVEFDGMTAIEYAKAHNYNYIVRAIEEYELPVKGVQDHGDA